MARDPDCLFCRIVTGEIPATIVHQDARVTAFRDVNPQMPVHTLIVPNDHVANTEAIEFEHEPIVGAVLAAARTVARIEGVDQTGYRLVVNTGADALNTVPHLHVHLLGGRKMSWPPG